MSGPGGLEHGYRRLTAAARWRAALPAEPGEPGVA
jgi:hypothetical protein